MEKSNINDAIYYYGYKVSKEDIDYWVYEAQYANKWWTSYDAGQAKGLLQGIIFAMADDDIKFNHNDIELCELLESAIKAAGYDEDGVYFPEAHKAMRKINEIMYKDPEDNLLYDKTINGRIKQVTSNFRKLFGLNKNNNTNPINPVVSAPVAAKPTTAPVTTREIKNNTIVLEAEQIVTNDKNIDKTLVKPKTTGTQIEPTNAPASTTTAARKKRAQKQAAITTKPDVRQTAPAIQSIVDSLMSAAVKRETAAKVPVAKAAVASKPKQTKVTGTKATTPVKPVVVKPTTDEQLALDFGFEQPAVAAPVKTKAKRTRKIIQATEASTATPVTTTPKTVRKSRKVQKNEDPSQMTIDFHTEQPATPVPVTNTPAPEIQPMGPETITTDNGKKPRKKRTKKDDAKQQDSEVVVTTPIDAISETVVANEPKRKKRTSKKKASKEETQFLIDFDAAQSDVPVAVPKQTPITSLDNNTVVTEPEIQPTGTETITEASTQKPARKKRANKAQGEQDVEVVANKPKRKKTVKKATQEDNQPATAVVEPQPEVTETAAPVIPATIEPQPAVTETTDTNTEKITNTPAQETQQPRKRNVFTRAAALISSAVVMGALILTYTYKSATGNNTTTDDKAPTFKTVIAPDTTYNIMQDYNPAAFWDNPQIEYSKPGKTVTTPEKSAAARATQKDNQATTDSVAVALTRASESALDILIGKEKAANLCRTVQSQIDAGIFVAPNGMSAQQIAHAATMSRIYEGKSIVLDALQSKTKLTPAQQAAFEQHIDSIGDMGVKLQQRMAAKQKLSSHSKYDQASKQLQKLHQKNLKYLKQMKQMNQSR